MNVIQIVEKYLRDIGADGLVEESGECGCLLGDIAPCGDIESGCVPAMNRPDLIPDGDELPDDLIWMVTLELDKRKPKPPLRKSRITETE